MAVRSKFTASLLLVFVVIAAFSFKASNYHTTNSLSANNPVKVEGGLITGSSNAGKDIRIYKGIPFAAPPVGTLRWKAPQPVIPWTGVKTCTAFGPSPMQPSPAPFSMWSEEFLIPKEPIGEDCLYLNVWTGAATSKEKRPVLVWIYGGGFSSGGAGCPIYDGTAMAKKGIIFVSINYRVGIFGFFAHPELTRESGHNASGNYGLMDQVAALKWVQKNIAAFGGDASNVTIAGQSAGSMSVNCLVATSFAKNLFNKAIGESGASFTNNAATLQAVEADGARLLKSLNAATINDARNIPADELMKKGNGFRGPIVDGYVMPDAISKLFAKGKENKVSLLTGWNQDEGLVFGPIKKADDFKKDAEKNYTSDANTFLHFYPADNDSIAAASQLNLSRDMIFGVQNYTWANIQTNKGTNVYVYRFVRKPPATGDYVKYGAFHTGEVPYAYNNLSFVQRPWQAVDYELANTMSSYWANFVKTGNPNGNNLPRWEAYHSIDKKIMILAEKPGSAIMKDSEMLDFLYKKMSAK